MQPIGGYGRMLGQPREWQELDRASSLKTARVFTIRGTDNGKRQNI